MKNVLLFFIFFLFLDGVFGESVSVMEGDSVTLHTELTEIQKDHVIEWRFGSDLIARINRPANTNKTYDDDLDGKFKDRLKLQEQNGDLTIINIRTTDSGDYKVTISSKTKIFNVKVVPADGVESVTVNEGDSVTLRTGLTEIQRDDVIQWRFGQQKSPVAEINRKAGIFNTYDGPDERFRDRLQLDSQTGSLTIMNTRTTHSGLYEVDIIIISSRYTVHKSFSVTVSGEIKSVSGTEGESVTLQIVTEVQNDDLIHWMFGDNVIAEIHKADRRFYTSDVPDGKFRGRLDLDRQTGSLIIMNTRTTDSGDYQLKISSSRRTINRRITVTVTDSGLSPAAVAGIVGGVVGGVLLVAAAAGVIFYRHKISVLKSQREENGGNHKKQETDDPAGHQMIINESIKFDNL